MRAIAKTLRVPMAWLGGEVDELPFANYLKTRTDQAGNRTTYTSGGNEPPSLQHLVEHEFGKKLFQALADREPRSDAHRQGRLTDPSHFWASWAVRRLISPGSWAAKLLAVPQGAKLRWSRKDYEEAVAALAKAFAIILEPWFRQEVEFDNRQLLLTVTKFDVDSLPGGEDTIRSLMSHALWPDEGDATPGG